MKKVKIMMGGAAFLIAIAAAFANKTTEKAPLADYYKKSGGDCIEETFCHPLNTGDLCDYTVYSDKDECKNAVVARKP